MKCDSCGQDRLTGDLRWHGREAKWHCSSCLPVAGGSLKRPAWPHGGVAVLLLIPATAITLAGLYALKILAAAGP